jgi:hypothetical protein
MAEEDIKKKDEHGPPQGKGKREERKRRETRGTIRRQRKGKAVGVRDNAQDLNRQTTSSSKQAATQTQPLAGVLGRRLACKVQIYSS